MIVYYYLHVNGELIRKDAGVVDADTPAMYFAGDFVVQYWKLDTDRREDAWSFVCEALAFGARRDRVFELAAKWGLTNEDAFQFAKRTGIELVKKFDLYLASVGSVTGQGKTAIDALALLRREGNRAAGIAQPQTGGE